MNAQERRAVSGLAGIFVLRMLGLFLILPVFALYAQTLQGYEPWLMGLTLGIYGLTQGLLQIPFGMLSDRIGRRPVIAAGLLIFAAGSVFAALADTLVGVLAGRALQGAGAIAAVVMALTADLTRENQRTKAMALIGMSIGAAFVLSLLLASNIDNLIGVSGIFWLTAALAIGGLLVLFVWVPAPAGRPQTAPAGGYRRQLTKALKDRRLLRLDAGIFILHAALTAMFVVIPISLTEYAKLPKTDFWQVYVPVMLLSAVFLLPMIVLAERRHWIKQFFLVAIVVLVLSQTLLIELHTSLYGIAISLFLFFLAFNLLEAMLPSLISRTVEARSKGTALGVYSSFEFFGAFVGGTVGGVLYGWLGIPAVYGFVIALLVLWFLIALGMTMPKHETIPAAVIEAATPEAIDR